jgi:hypothetical protein
MSSLNSNVCTLLYRITTCIAFSFAKANQFCARGDEENILFGKAYIISTKIEVPQYTLDAAIACGFQPQILPAVLPFEEQFKKSRENMFRYCFETVGKAFLPYEKSFYASRVTLAEISLVCSHRLAMRLIAQDQSMSNSDWALIMEDDAKLVPTVSRKLARLFTIEAMKYSHWESSDEGVLYLGICHPRCKQELSVFANEPFTIGKSCAGHCTHAYAITKQTAKSLFANMYTWLYLKGGWLQSDQAMRHYFMANSQQNSYPLAHVVGHNFISPEESGHRGLMYQANRTFDIYSKIVAGTVLKSDVFIPQTCFIMRGDGTTITKMLFKYATLVGFCLSRNRHPHHCASFVSGEDATTSAAVIPGAFDAFVKGFGIRDVSCTPNTVIVKDTQLSSEQRNASFNNIPDSISFGTTFVGSFESLQLFPGVETWLRQFLTPLSPYNRGKSSDIESQFPTTVLNWLPGSIQTAKTAISTSPCAPSAVEVCVFLSGKGASTENEKDKDSSLRRTFAPVVQHLANKYSNGVALRIVLERTVKETQLQSFLSLPTAQNGSTICVRSLHKYGDTKEQRTDYFDYDMWAIRQLQGCRRIVLGRSLLGWWGAYLSSGEVIISSQVKHTLPEWTVI